MKPTCVAKEAIKRLNEFFGPRRIIIVTTSARFCEKFTSFGRNVECMPEENLIPGKNSLHTLEGACENVAS